MATNPVLKESSSSPKLAVLPNDIIGAIWDQYEDQGEASVAAEWANSKALKDRVTCWCKWFADNHPGATPIDLVNLEKWDVDFRIFFLALPVPGAHLLRFADACYEVDKAICGTSAASLRVLEELQRMDPFKYILSEDLIARWKEYLSQLLNDIEHDIGNRLSNMFRVDGIANAFYQINGAVDDIFIDEVFRTVEEYSFLSTSLILEDRINTCQIILEKSLKILRLAMEQADQRAQTNTIKPLISATSTIYQDPERINQGVRRRVPTTLTSNGDSPSNEAEERNPVFTQVSSPYSSGASSKSMPQIMPNIARLGFSSSIDAVWQTVAKILKSNGAHRNRNKLLDFLIHKSTVLCLTLCVVGTSVALIAVAIIHAQIEVIQQKTPLDSNFYSMFSQAMLSLLTIYLTILPPLRSKELNLRYRSWFWLCLFFSALANITSLGVYVSQPTVSVVFGYGASFAQVVSTLLLVECVEKTVKAGVIGELEMNEGRNLEE